MGNLPNPVAMVALLAALGITPFAALMVTSYTKLVVVFGLLRSAPGIQQVPPNIVLNGIALILSVYIMAPVGMDIGDHHLRAVQAAAVRHARRLVRADSRLDPVVSLRSR